MIIDKTPKMCYTGRSLTESGNARGHHGQMVEHARLGHDLVRGPGSPGTDYGARGIGGLQGAGTSRSPGNGRPGRRGLHGRRAIPASGFDRRGTGGCPTRAVAGACAAALAARHHASSGVIPPI